MDGIELKVSISLWFHDWPVPSVQGTGLQARKFSVDIVMLASQGELEFLTTPHCVPLSVEFTK